MLHVGDFQDGKESLHRTNPCVEQPVPLQVASAGGHAVSVALLGELVWCGLAAAIQAPKTPVDTTVSLGSLSRIVPVV